MLRIVKDLVSRPHSQALARRNTRRRARHDIQRLLVRPDLARDVGLSEGQLPGAAVRLRWKP